MEEKDMTLQEREKEERRVEREKKTKKNQRKGGNAIAPGEGRREISWLWMGTATGDETDATGMHDGRCICFISNAGLLADIQYNSHTGRMGKSLGTHMALE